MKSIILLLALTLTSSIGFAEETIMTFKTHRDVLEIASILTRTEVLKCVKKMVDGESGPRRVDGEELSRGIDFMPEQITETTFVDSETKQTKEKIIISGRLVQGGDAMKGRGTLEIEIGTFARTKCASQATIF